MKDSTLVKKHVSRNTQGKQVGTIKAKVCPGGKADALLAVEVIVQAELLGLHSVRSGRVFNGDMPQSDCQLNGQKSWHF
jgi:hypothetical protein